MVSFFAALPDWRRLHGDFAVAMTDLFGLCSARPTTWSWATKNPMATRPSGAAAFGGIGLHGPGGRQEQRFPTSEGVEPKRHIGTAVISFNDGHSEARKSTLIDPPANPHDGSAKALGNSRYWDPLQRGGLQ
jgi:hypothetical protein